MLKKMMLLAGMALAAVAFMAPAMAQADKWVTHEGTVGETTETADDITFTGTLSSTAGGGAVKSGPCEVEATVDVWNVGGTVATAEVTSFSIFTPCEVSSPFPIIPPGCSLTGATSEGFPWHVDISGSTGVSITGANFTNVYTGCAPTLPAEVTAEGTATGQAENIAGGSCIAFNNSGDMTTPNGAVTIDGKVCASGLTLVS